MRGSAGASIGWAMAFVACGLLPRAAGAAENFQIRYNVAGTIGGEIFAPPDRAGWGGSVVYSYAHIRKVTGEDGGALMLPMPGGTVPLPAPTPPALYPAFGPGAAEVKASGRLQQLNLLVGYVSDASYNGGRWLLSANLPYAARKTQETSVAGATPPLNFAPAVPAPARAAATAQFNTQYQAGVAAMGESTQVSGIGDVEVQALWMRATDAFRVSAGTALVMPTGKYDAARGVDVGQGNFYTLRPAVQGTWLPTPMVGLSARLSAGFNSRNTDNDLRSGNWLGLELAAGYRTPIGVVGLHGIRVQQVQDDSNNPFGASRLRSNNAGVFFTTVLPRTDALLTFQLMATTDSRNARHGEYAQVRLSKLF